MQQAGSPVPPSAAPSPQTDMAALVSHQAELSASLSRLRMDQRRLVGEIQAAGGTPSASAQQQLVQVDLAIANAQAELSASRSAISSGMESSISMRASPVAFDALSPGSPFTFVLVLGLFVALLTGAIWRGVRRSRGVPSAADASDILSARLDRVDQSLDAIAIEVERIAESQRFVAKTLAEFATNRGK